MACDNPEGIPLLNRTDFISYDTIIVVTFFRFHSLFDLLTNNSTYHTVLRLQHICVRNREIFNLQLNSFFEITLEYVSGDCCGTNAIVSDRLLQWGSQCKSAAICSSGIFLKHVRYLSCFLYFSSRRTSERNALERFIRKYLGRRTANYWSRFQLACEITFIFSPRSPTVPSSYPSKHVGP